MKRREFFGVLGGAMAWPLTARAQQPHQLRRIGVLMVSGQDEPDTTARLAGFRQGLERLGWMEGRNVRVDYRFAAGRADQFQPLAKELVALQPEAILAHSTPIAAALQRESRAIPIVFTNVSDPIGSGFIASLARPGGNLTGLMLYEEGITGKWLAMLKEIAPALDRAAVIGNPKTTPYDYFLRSAELIAPRSRSSLCPAPSRAPGTSNASYRSLHACRTAAYSCCRTAPTSPIVICSSRSQRSTACPPSISRVSLCGRRPHVLRDRCL